MQLAPTPAAVPAATLVAKLAAKPGPITEGGKDLVAVTAELAGPAPIPLMLLARAKSQVASALISKNAGDLLIVSGDLALDGAGNTPVITARVLCNATADQYPNEIVLVGRLAGDSAKVAESGKSASRSLAVNRYSNQEETTDWWKLRGYGYLLDRLVQSAKGALVEATGALELRTNKDGAPYVELKLRTLRTHGKSKATGAAPNPAAGTSAAGYDHDSFSSSAEDMPLTWS